MKLARPQRPHLLKVLPPLQNSIVVKGDEISWNNPWHFHPELELLYCITGKGTNYIGNCIQPIEEGEVLLFGKNLPHTRQRDKQHYETHADEIPQTVVVQFKEDFVGRDFFGLSEFQHIPELFVRAQSGIKFFGDTRTHIARRLTQLRHMEPAMAVLELISILDVMARSQEYKLLNKENAVHCENSSKINRVYEYTHEHFRKAIQLEEVAALTNHSPTAFCRFFKKHTRKSYFQYLTEVRISYACELLMEGNRDVTEVCFASGFNNLSNFHKQFRKVVKCTPKAYKMRALSKVPVMAA